MIDIKKLRRFERTLEKYNTSTVVADFWNELEQQIDNVMQYIETMENDMLEQKLRHDKFVRLVNRLDNLEIFTRKTLEQAKKWKERYGH